MLIALAVVGVADGSHETALKSILVGRDAFGTRLRDLSNASAIIGTWPADRPDPTIVAAQVQYRPSAEHKNYPSPTGPRILA
jgi:hypothetical protein